MRLTGNNAGYVISFPIRGPMLALHRGRELDIGPGKAVVFRPFAEVMMMTDDNFDVLVVRIDAAALEDALEARLGYPVRRPLVPTLDLGTAAARGWAASLRHIVDAAVPGGLLGNPMIAEPLQDSLLDGFGPSTTRTGSLDAPVPSWGPRTVRRGVDVIEASPQQPFTMAALAADADADVSVRAFEECWSRHRAPAPCPICTGPARSRTPRPGRARSRGRRRSRLRRCDGASRGLRNSRLATPGAMACPQARPCEDRLTPERRSTEFPAAQVSADVG
ncbi:MAG: hypothetical protein ACRDRR_06015 [Pseudonocardiaceae bacterium]